jgi:uncharacterized protein
VIVTWDEPKRRANIEAHGIDLADAELFDWDNALIRPTTPDGHGRERFKAIGTLGDRVVTLIFSSLGSEAISVISMRPAGTKERKLYVQQ